MKCVICGNEFIGNKRAKYCSDPCRKEAANRKRRKGTRIKINKGDIFETWTVLEKCEGTSKNAKYLCECTCGNRKVFRSDVLLDHKFGKCEECGSKDLIQMKSELIKSRWNETLNCDEVHLEYRDLKSKYYFTCPEGHNYLSTIWDLNEKCPVCESLKTQSEEVVKMGLNFDEFILGMDNRMSKFNNYYLKVDMEKWLMYIKMENFAIICKPKQHNIFNQAIHKSKAEFMKIHTDLNSFREECRNDPTIDKIIELEIDLADDYRGERIKLIAVICSLEKGDYDYLYSL